MKKNDKNFSFPVAGYFFVLQNSKHYCNDVGGGSISIHVFVQIIVITVMFSLISSCLCFYVVQTLCDLNLFHCPVNKTNSQCDLHQERLVKW